MSEIGTYIMDDFKEIVSHTHWVVDLFFGMIRFIFIKLSNLLTPIAKQWKMFFGLLLSSILILPFIKNKEVLLYIIFYASSIVAGLIVIGWWFSLIEIEIIIIKSIIKGINSLIKINNMGKKIEQKLKFVMEKIRLIFKIIGLVIAFFVVLALLIPLLWIFPKISTGLSMVYKFFSINVNTDMGIMTNIRYGLKGMYNLGDVDVKMDCTT